MNRVEKFLEATGALITIYPTIQSIFRLYNIFNIVQFIVNLAYVKAQKKRFHLG